MDSDEIEINTNLMEHFDYVVLNQAFEVNDVTKAVIEEWLKSANKN